MLQLFLRPQVRAGCTVYKTLNKCRCGQIYEYCTMYSTKMNIFFIVLLYYHFTMMVNVNRYMNTGFFDHRLLVIYV